MFPCTGLPGGDGDAATSAPVSGTAPGGPWQAAASPALVLGHRVDLARWCGDDGDAQS